MSKGLSGHFLNTIGEKRYHPEEFSKNSIEECLHNEIKKWAYEKHKELTGKAKKNFNTSCVAFDDLNHKYYYGVNGGYREPGYKKSPILFGDETHSGILPKISLNKYPVGNCAEVDAINRALNAGAQLSNIHLITIHTTKNQFGTFKQSCENCTFAFKNKSKLFRMDKRRIIMNNKFNMISMNGRMAYIIMCVEKYLILQYPQKDWTIVIEKMWKATSNNWADWANEYSAIIPDVLLQYAAYDEEEHGDSITETDFDTLKKLYNGITEGIEDDSYDEVNYMLNKPYEMAMIYEGTIIGDGKESFHIIEESENILKRNNIPLPDYSRVLFSSSNELNGWGNDFDGTFLSPTLNGKH